jgi:hypothetical protein
MRSRMEEMTRMIVATALAAATIAISPCVTGQIWSPVMQKIQAGSPFVGVRIEDSNLANYCSVASTPGIDFTWTDMVHSGLEYSYVWTTWATSCPTAVAKVAGAEIFFSKRVNFITKAYFRAPDPGADQLQIKEMGRATDGGAMVIIIEAEDQAQAQQIVQRAYYPPMGARDLGPGQYNTVYPASVTGGNYVGTYNSNVVVIASIGTVAGVSQAKMIAATPGINALYLDTMNLESDSGYPQGSPDFNKLAEFVTVSALASHKYLCAANRSATPNTITCAKNLNLYATN